MTDKYKSDAMQRFANAIKVLAGYESHGLTSGDIAKKIEVSASQATAVIANLKQAGFAELCPWDDKRIRLTAEFSRMANTITFNLNQRYQQVQLDQQNYAGIK